MKKSSYMKHELIGEGSFGCIFIPEIPCTSGVEILNKEVKGRQTVGKVFTYYDNKYNAIETEKKLARLVNKWDPQGLYFAIPNKICKTTMEMVKKHPAAEQCSELNYFDRAELDQIVMPYYGLDLGEYMKKYMELFKRKFPVEFFIPMVKNLLLGVAVLQNHKGIHMDIKSSNILFDNFKARIIDFSLLRTYGEVYKMDKFKSRLQYSYLPYPLEFLLVYHYHYMKCKESECSIYRHFIDTLNSFGSTSYRSFLKFHTLNEIIKTIADLEQWIKDTPGWFEMINQKADVIDVYSIGMVCVDLEEYLDYSTLSKVAKGNYIKFVKELTAIDFRKRPNALEALQLFDRLFFGLVWLLEGSYFSDFISDEEGKAQSGDEETDPAPESTRTIANAFLIQ